MQQLEDAAEVQEVGLSWHTAPEWLDPDSPESAAGYYNLGLAHGVPGVIAFLARLLPTNVAPAQVRRLLAGAVQWLLRQKDRDERGSYRYFVGSPGTRLAWCYGDLGVAQALLLAGRLNNEPRWELEALDLARGRPAAR